VDGAFWAFGFAEAAAGAMFFVYVDFDFAHCFSSAHFYQAEGTGFFAFFAVCGAHVLVHFYFVDYLGEALCLKNRHSFLPANLQSKRTEGAYRCADAAKMAFVLVYADFGASRLLVLSFDGFRDCYGFFWADDPADFASDASFFVENKPVTPRVHDSFDAGFAWRLSL
jgi:hypothetical protein